jgi:hypothetical protein
MTSFAESPMQIIRVQETNRFAAVDDNGVLTTVIEFTGGVRQADPDVDIWEPRVRRFRLLDGRDASMLADGTLLVPLGRVRLRPC